jgi:hypothetical protein
MNFYVSVQTRLNNKVKSTFTLIQVAKLFFGLQLECSRDIEAQVDVSSFEISFSLGNKRAFG